MCRGGGRNLRRVRRRVSRGRGMYLGLGALCGCGLRGCCYVGVEVFYVCNDENIKSIVRLIIENWS